MRKYGGFKKKENPSKAATTNDLCHKSEKSGHLIRDCPMYKIEYKDYAKPGGNKDKLRDLNPNKKSRKIATML